ncbi:MAG: pyridoxal 5'-phosphate synthase glutaminase subunit PdxT [Gordonibacter sp.]|nr:pyridoxal 5'-phosphate synthase glutaminase subunit PdxT [Gordonibacter sp.]
MNRPTIGVLAVQGAFAEHEKRLEELGASYVELRQAADLNQHLDGLVLPGGESTAQDKIIGDLGMRDLLIGLIEGGIPVLATCAGMVLLAEHLEGFGDLRSQMPVNRLAISGLGTMPISVCRNAYGRQLGSFNTRAEFKGIGEVPMTFIRAPYVTCVGEGVDILAEVNERAVAVRFGSQIATSFHPELDSDVSIHSLFLDLCIA